MVLPRLELALLATLRRTAIAHGDILAAAQNGNLDAYRQAMIDHYEPLLRMLGATATKADREPSKTPQ